MNVRQGITRAFSFALAASTLALGAAAHAGEWPDKPVVVMVPFATGGATQALIERVGRQITAQIGQSLLPNYRGGAGGTIAAEAAAKAQPDGYTMFMGATGALAVAPAVMDVRFDPVKDFTPVALIATTPYVMVINSKLPIHNVPELIEYARQNPGKLNFGSSGAGGADHIAGEVFQNMAGVKITHVPYKGAGPLMPDLLSGRLDMAILSPIPVKPHIQSGQLRALGVTTKARSPALKEIPSIAEQGLPDYDLTAWYGFLAPAGTPSSVVERLNQATMTALHDQDILAYLDGQGLTPGTGSPGEFAAFVRQEIGKWGESARMTGVRIQ